MAIPGEPVTQSAVERRFEHDEAPALPVKVLHVTGRKRATGHIRNAAIEVLMPRHWAKAAQKDVIETLSQRLQRQFAREYQLLKSCHEQRLTFTNKKLLEAWIREINTQTLRVPLKGIRMGYSRYTHLAQMNLQSHVMTISKFCLTEVPASALRYLVIHELAHLKVPNHSKAFWDAVRPHVPDYRHQRRVIAATHRIRIYEADLRALNAPPPETKPIQAVYPEPSLLKQLLLKLF